MEEEKKTIAQNTEEDIQKKAGEPEPDAENVVDDDIQYTFVVPKGEVYTEPDTDEGTDADDAEGAGAAADPGDSDASEGADDTENAADPGDEFFKTYKEADLTGKTRYPEPPVYAATGLPDDDDITYTFVVPRGEIYKEPDPDEEQASAQGGKTRVAAASENAAQEDAEAPQAESGASADGSNEDADAGKTRYGLPVNHPGMGELAQKQEARRLYKQRKKNRFRTRFYVLLTVLVLAIGWLILSHSGIFTIDAIVVKGNSHYTAEEIINMAHASPGHNIIYQANIKETKGFLENNPYIKHAEVRRRLPSTLVIRVTERQERLAFKYDDDYLVMDEDGILLRKTRNKPMTTILKGVVVSKIKLGEKIGTENGRLMDMGLDLIQMMIKSDLYYVKVDISDIKNVKAYIYDTLVVKADYDTLMTNMENGKLHLVVENLFGDGIERGTITFLEDGSASFMPTF